MLGMVGVKKQGNTLHNFLKIQILYIKTLVFTGVFVLYN